jgi:2',3'-cyclic-nucleotide 2'-phosphodiesterase (5'-nucleotidase family)
MRRGADLVVLSNGPRLAAPGSPPVPPRTVAKNPIPGSTMTLRHFIVLGLAAAALAAGPASAQQVQYDNFTVFFTGDVQGEVKSCGCPKLDLGGATRREAFLDTLRSVGWTFLTVDAGGLTPFGEMNAQKRLKIEHLARAMARMQIDAVGLGDWDLAQGREFVRSLIGWLEQPAVATNVAFPAGIDTRETVRLTIRGKDVAVVGFLDPDLVTEAHDWITVTPWGDHRPLLQSLRGEVDLIVALAGVADSSRMVALAETLPEIDLVIGSHRADLPANLSTVGTTHIVGGGGEGKYLGRAEIVFDENDAVTDVQSTFLQVVKEWGRRRYIDEVVTDYNRAVRDLMLSGAGDDQGALNEP